MHRFIALSDSGCGFGLSIPLPYIDLQEEIDIRARQFLQNMGMVLIRATITIYYHVDIKLEAKGKTGLVPPFLQNITATAQLFPGI